MNFERPSRATLRKALGASVVLACLVAPFVLRPTLRFYSDGSGLREEARSARPSLREVLWAPAGPVGTEINRPETDEYEPAVSPDGRHLVFTRGRPGGSADLWIADRVGLAWRGARPLELVNTPFDELGASLAFEREGSQRLALYFSSNRPGGQGGYDIWVSLSDGGDGWSVPRNLGRQVNSAWTELRPSAAPGSELLFFASNRKEGEEPGPPHWSSTVRETLGTPGYNLFSAPRLAGEQLELGEATLSGALSLPDANEASVAVAPFGDFVYFTSDRPGGLGGFDLYRARLVNGRIQSPENLGPRINTAGHELDPAVGLGGFELYFARRPPGASSEDIFVTRSREVFLAEERGDPYLDAAALLRALRSGLARLDPALLALLLSFLLCLIFALIFGRRMSRLALLTRCFLLAILAHLIAALWMSSSRVHRALLGTLGGGPVEVEAIEVSLEPGVEEEVGFAIRGATAETGGDAAPALAGLERSTRLEAAATDLLARLPELEPLAASTSAVTVERVGLSRAAPPASRPGPLQDAPAPETAQPAPIEGSLEAPDRSVDPRALPPPEPAAVARSEAGGPEELTQRVELSLPRVRAIERLSVDLELPARAEEALPLTALPPAQLPEPPPAPDGRPERPGEAVAQLAAPEEQDSPAAARVAGARALPAPVVRPARPVESLTSQRASARGEVDLATEATLAPRAPDRRETPLSAPQKAAADAPRGEVGVAGVVDSATLPAALDPGALERAAPAVKGVVAAEAAPRGREGEPLSLASAAREVGPSRPSREAPGSVLVPSPALAPGREPAAAEPESTSPGTLLREVALAGEAQILSPPAIDREAGSPAPSARAQLGESSPRPASEEAPDLELARSAERRAGGIDGEPRQQLVLQPAGQAPQQVASVTAPDRAGIAGETPERPARALETEGTAALDESPRGAAGPSLDPNLLVASRPLAAEQSPAVRESVLRELAPGPSAHRDLALSAGGESTGGLQPLPVTHEAALLATGGIPPGASAAPAVERAATESHAAELLAREGADPAPGIVGAVRGVSPGADRPRSRETDLPRLEPGFRPVSSSVASTDGGPGSRSAALDLVPSAERPGAPEQPRGTSAPRTRELERPEILAAGALPPREEPAAAAIVARSPAADPLGSQSPRHRPEANPGLAPRRADLLAVANPAAARSEASGQGLERLVARPDASALVPEVASALPLAPVERERPVVPDPLLPSRGGASEPGAPARELTPGPGRIAAAALSGTAGGPGAPGENVTIERRTQLVPPDSPREHITSAPARESTGRGAARVAPAPAPRGVLPALDLSPREGELTPALAPPPVPGAPGLSGDRASSGVELAAQTPTRRSSLALQPGLGAPRPAPSASEAAHNRSTSAGPVHVPRPADSSLPPPAPAPGRGTTLTAPRESPVAVLGARRDEVALGDRPLLAHIERAAGVGAPVLAAPVDRLRAVRLEGSPRTILPAASPGGETGTPGALAALTGSTSKEISPAPSLAGPTLRPRVSSPLGVRETVRNESLAPHLPGRAPDPGLEPRAARDRDLSAKVPGVQRLEPPVPRDRGVRLEIVRVDILPEEASPRARPAGRAARERLPAQPSSEGTFPRAAARALTPGSRGLAALATRPERSAREPGSLEPVQAATSFVPKIYQLRAKNRREDALRQGGGSEETERAVLRGLAWLALHQSPDGRWDLKSYTKHLDHVDDRDLHHPDWDGSGEFDSRGGTSRAENGDTGATGLSILAFLGHGDTHLEEGPHRLTVEKGIQYLLRKMQRDGDLRGGGNLYMHAISTFALCEAYALTRDPALEGPCRRAIGYALRTQNPDLGGWRYEPYPQGKEVDTSVFGWMLMAVKSAHLAGIEIDRRAVTRMWKYLDSVRMTKNGGRFAYQPGLPRSSIAMTAQGLFSQQILMDLKPPTTEDEKVRLRRATNEAVSIMLSNRPERRDQDGCNFYYWYYATLALFQEEGVAWETWNARLKEVLLGLQLGDEEGTAAGSWDPLDRRATLGGRVYSTAISVLTLEVYYRYAPKEGGR